MRDLTNELMLEAVQAPVLVFIAGALLMLGCHYLFCRGRASRPGPHGDAHSRRRGVSSQYRGIRRARVEELDLYDDEDMDGSDVIADDVAGGRIMLYSR